MTIGLIGCGAKKRSEACRAEDLYTGPVFTSAKKYIKTRVSAWGILSAKHGLLLPEVFIAPYDVMLTKMKKEERTSWADHVGEELITRWPDENFLVVAGLPYRQALEGLPYRAPFAGLTVGRLLQALKEAR